MKYKYRYQYFIRCLALACLCTAYYPILAQQEDDGKASDSTAAGGDTMRESSALFDVNKAYSTSAISSVSGGVLYRTPVANLSNTLYGLVPGLTVLQGSGEPGNDRASLAIRGIGSFNFGDYAVFVDGFQTTFNYLQYLSPSEIDNISILKDAAALAPFGMKGANGVIWVTTKRGRPGKTNIRVQARSGFQSPVNINKPLSSYEYASLYNEAVSNDNGRVWTPAYNASDLQAYRNGSGANTQWYNEVLKRQGYFTSADASFDGGSEAARFFVMLGYMKNQGLYNVDTDDTHANAGLQQFNLRTNLDFSLFEIFEGKVDIGGRIEDRKYPNYATATLWDNLAKYPANIYAPRNPEGTWAGTSTFPDNPLASIRELGYNSTHDRTIQANFSLREKLDFITPGLYLQEAASFSTWTRGTYNVTRNYARFLNGTQQTTDQNTNYSIFDDYGTNQYFWNQAQVQLGYERDFGVHAITTAVNYLQYSYNVDANQNGAAGVNTAYSFRNLGGRLHYEYDDRYVAEFGFAYSGSDNFAKGNRYEFYPSVSVAWLASNTAFLKESSTIGQLKVRASVGKSGYDQFSGGRYLYQLYYAYTGGYPTGNGAVISNGGLAPSYIPNPDISAEQSMKYNIGADARLFGMLDVTLDAYIDKRSNIVAPDNSFLAVLGDTPPYRNIGKVTSRGIEASLLLSRDLGGLSYHLGVMGAYNSNTIDYMAEIPPVTPNAAQTGRSISTLFGYEAIGFYDVSDFNADGTLVAALPVSGLGAVQPGDIRYKDINGDQAINEKDMVVIGNSFFPKWNYSIQGGVKYRGFDLNVLFQGVSGRDVNLLDAAEQTIAFRDNGNAYALAGGRWAYYPDEGIDTRATATYPRLSALDNTNNYRNSSFWVKNGAYLRLRNIEIGYTVPANGWKRVNGIRIFASGVNLLTWSPLLRDYNIDPETMSGYPALKSFNLGFTLHF